LFFEIKLKNIRRSIVTPKPHAAMPENLHAFRRSATGTKTDGIGFKLVKSSKTGIAPYNCAEADAYNNAVKDGAKWDN
jgi:hypothetical protein